MALASPRVRSTAVEAQEFPELARHYEVSAVPKIVLNERVEFMGAVPEPMFLEAVLAAVSEEGGPEGDGGEATGTDGVEPTIEPAPEG
jgi:predicted DsbA family dithiol-disulfide isomerase